MTRPQPRPQALLPLLAVTISLWLAQANDGRAQAGANPSIERWARGTIEYRMLDSGKSIGSEQWHLTVHGDGSRTMQTVNRLDLVGAQRHVTLRVAENFRPLDLTAVYFTGGAWRGTGLFTVNGNSLDATINTPGGVIRQTLEVPEQFSFIPHPLSTDAWATWTYDKARGGIQSRTIYDLDSQATKETSMLGSIYDQPLEFMGTKEVTTSAGTFQTDHFRAGDQASIYVTGPDSILVRFVFESAAFSTEFILTSLETGGDETTQREK